MKILRQIKNKYREYLLKKDHEYFQKEFYNKAILSYPPRYVSIAITHACAFKCEFCAYHSDDAKGKSKVYNIPFRITVKDYKRMVDCCYKGRVPHVHITATGDPFLHPNILELLDYTIRMYGDVSVQTDFDKRIFDKKNYCDELIKRGNAISYITTDILSGNPEQHEKIKKGSNYDDLLSKMAYISQHTNIVFKSHLILTKYNYFHLTDLIDDLSRRRINGSLEIVNLHPSNFNDFTSPDAVYTSKDKDITQALEAAKMYGENKGIRVNIPKPFDKGTGQCGAFWSRFQIWPVQGNDPERYHENVILGGCNAVVNGNLNTLGYFFDYENIMDLWNNEYFVTHRRNLLKGIYPDKECKYCQTYKSE